MKKTHASARINFAKKSLSIAIAPIVAGLAGSVHAEGLPIITGDYEFQQDALIGGILIDGNETDVDRVTVKGDSILTISSPSSAKNAIEIVHLRDLLTIDTDLKITDWGNEHVFFLTPSSHLMREFRTSL